MVFRSLAISLGAIPLLASLLAPPAMGRSLADGPWSIRAGSDALEGTAAEDLRAFVSERLGAAGDLSPDPEDVAGMIHVGTPEDHPLIDRQHASRSFTLTDDPESYHLSWRDGALYVVGRSPKGAMNGVYRLINRGPGALRQLDLVTLDEHGSPAFRYRIGDHLRTQKAPPDWSEEQQARWYAQHFINVVWGEKFGPPLSYEARKKYGLSLMLEASLPPTPEGTHWGETGHKSPWWDDPNNASAIYFWGKPSWYGKVKVVDPFDPVGRQAYLDHFNNLLQRNPDTKILYCIFGDYSWAPNEQSTRVSDGKKFEHTQEEAIGEILRLMRDAIGQRDVIPAVWMWLLFPKQGKERFMEEMTADGIGVMYNEASDNDCWTYLRDNFDKVSLQLGPDGTTKFGPQYIPLVSIGGTCESVRPGVGMPLPHVGASKTLKLRQAGVQNFIIWWGSCEGWAYQANIEALAEMIWNPAAFDATHRDPFNPQNPEPLIDQIAQRDFGALAPQVLKFWESFDQALVDVDLRTGEKTGLQNQSWYQRTGNYLIFLHGQTIPLIPAELANKGKVSSLFPWILRPHAEENWRTVRTNLASSIAQLGELTRQSAPDDVAWRLRTMHLNTQAFFRIFANMHNHMRALQVMERLSHLPHASPRLKAEVAPIVRDDIANTEALIELLGQFPSNFFLSGKHERDSKPTRDAEIAKLREKIAAMRNYLAAPINGTPNLAAGVTLRHEGDATTIELPQPASVEVAVLRWNQPVSGDWSLGVSEDGRAWKSVGSGTVEGTSIIHFGPVQARAVRVKGAVDQLGAVELYGPPLLRQVIARSGAFRRPFNANAAEQELIVDAKVEAIELLIDAGSAERIVLDGREIAAGDVSVAVEPVLTLDVEARQGAKQSYAIRVHRNLAAGAKAIASSAEGSFVAANAVDGEPGADDDKSRWVSTAGSGDEHWLAVDLGEARKIARAVVVNGHQRATSHAMPAFRLQSSDDGGQSWRDIPGAAISENDRNLVELTFAPVTARHVRLLVTQTPDDRARVYELELYEQ